MRFGQPATRLVFAAGDLALPLTMADPVSRQIAYSACERSLEELGADGDVLARVRELLAGNQAGFRSLDEVASELHLSTRTLKRRLATVGVTYSEVLEEQRRETAVASFGRNPFRWTKSPSASGTRTPRTSAAPFAAGPACPPPPTAAPREANAAEQKLGWIRLLRTRARARARARRESR